MNYRKAYDSLISTRKSRLVEKGVYYEKHHILPRSMGGSDDPLNIVKLTAREHFIAHWLLWRIHSVEKTAYVRQAAHAFRYLCECRREKITSSRMFQEAREAARLHPSLKMKGKSHSHETIILMKKVKTLSNEEFARRGRDFYKTWCEKFGEEKAEYLLARRATKRARKLTKS